MKKILAIILCALALLALSPSALSHPGRTDSKGGHTDSATGKYHYHHGYPAHQHYDMNGDGRADCPYNFRDMTNRESSSKKDKKEDEGIFTSDDIPALVIVSLVLAYFASFFIVDKIRHQ